MMTRGLATTVAVLVFLTLTTLDGQDRLRRMPGYDQYSRIQKVLPEAYAPGTIQNLRWETDSRSFTYTFQGQPFRFDLNAMTAGPAEPQERPSAGRGRGASSGGLPATARGGLEQAQGEMPIAPVDGCPRVGVPRGRQAFCAMSPDGKRKAFYRARNFWIANADGSGERQITTDGSVEKRIKNGSGSWVYGEELDQSTAIWWSPDSSQVGYYRFDESQVLDFYLGMNQTGIQSVLDVEAYPKAGAPNPIPEVFVYDVSAARSTRIDVRDGDPFTDDVVGHYVYNVRWTPDGSALLLTRANRRQQVQELAACHPSNGSCRTVIREEWRSGWVDDQPVLHFLKDGKRFVWRSDRTGWSNYYLYDVSGRLLNPITTHTAFDAAALVRIDEDSGALFYMARDGDNHLKQQLHRVALDGSGDVRLTDPAFHHIVGTCIGNGAGCGISPDGRYFVDTYQTHRDPPAVQLVAIANEAAWRSETPAAMAAVRLTGSDLSKLDALGARRAEHFSYTAADGTTPLVGRIVFPTNFDPSRRWPALVSVYGGPGSASGVPAETFVPPNPIAEYGFVMVSLSTRAAPGRGKRLLDSVYEKLGVAEIDDMAQGVKALARLSYVDTDRVGIYGTSYGGYASLLMLLRYPDLIAAASASSPVTSWHHYDSIYTERYMWTPEGNRDGYDAGNAMTLAKNLRGRLLLYYGTADNNVHPNNTMQLVKALQAAGKSFELQVGPDAGHTSVNIDRMMEFFIENLVMRPERVRGT